VLKTLEYKLEEYQGLGSGTRSIGSKTRKTGEKEKM
jgi:hypothetical protein